MISPCCSSDGVLKKKWQIVDGKRCLIKAGTGFLSQEVFNETAANAICELLGIKKYTGYSAELINNRPVNICECFINENTELITAKDILAHFPANYRISPYEHYITCCKRLGFDPTKCLDEMIILDFIIGNTDRHYRNFGLIRDVNTLKILDAAPIYDSGTALCHDIPEALIDVNADIRSKPFADFHSAQIRLLSAPERFDPSKLDDLHDICENIFSRYDIIPQNRVNVLLKLIDTRVSMLRQL